MPIEKNSKKDIKDIPFKQELLLTKYELNLVPICFMFKLFWQA